MMEMAPVMMAVRWPLAIEGSSTAGRFSCSWLLPPAPTLPAAGGAASAALLCCCWPSPSAARQSRERRLGVVVGSQALRARRAAGRAAARWMDGCAVEDAMLAVAGAKARRAASELAAMAAGGSDASVLLMNATGTLQQVSETNTLRAAPAFRAVLHMQVASACYLHSQRARRIAIAL